MALVFKPTTAFIGAIVAAVTSVLTLLATQNPADAAIIGLISTGVTQGFSFYQNELNQPVAVSGTAAILPAATATAIANWPQIKGLLQEEVSKLPAAEQGYVNLGIAMIDAYLAGQPPQVIVQTAKSGLTGT